MSKYFLLRNLKIISQTMVWRIFLNTVHLKCKENSSLLPTCEGNRLFPGKQFSSLDNWSGVLSIMSNCNILECVVRAMERLCNSALELILQYEAKMDES